MRSVEQFCWREMQVSTQTTPSQPSKTTNYTQDHFNILSAPQLAQQVQNTETILD
jgi:hypothetical protein